MLYPTRLRFTPIVITDRTDEIVAPDMDAQEVLERNVEWVLPPLADAKRLFQRKSRKELLVIFATVTADMVAGVVERSAT